MNTDYYSTTFLASKVIPVLFNQYNNIDIRGIYVRNQQNPQWHCAFLKIYFTKDSRDAIENIYERKRKVVSVNESDLKFVSKCVNVTDALNLLKDGIDSRPELSSLKRPHLTEVQQIFKILLIYFN